MRIELPNYASWIACDDGIRGYASSYDGIRTNNGVSSYDEFAHTANNGCPETNPASFLDSDRSSIRNSLTQDRSRYIFKGMVMIHQQGRRGEHNITFHMDPVFC